MTCDSMELMPMGHSACSTPPSSAQYHHLSSQYQYGGKGVGRTSSSSMMAPLAASTIIMKTSSSVAAPTSMTYPTSEEKLLDRFGSMDSSDTFLSCNTHPFPSQGSLAGLEELAAIGSMAANGSMPSVNIPGFNSQTSTYMLLNPFDPQQRRSHKQRTTTATTTKQYSSKAEELNERRRVRMNLRNQRSISSDHDLSDDNCCWDPTGNSGQEKLYMGKSAEGKLGVGEGHKSDASLITATAPKHKRARISQVCLNSSRFVKDIFAGYGGLYIF